MVRVDEWSEGNLIIIRNYLKRKFPGYTITERSFPNLYHRFTVTNAQLHKSYGLKVDWSRLSDRKNTPARTRSSLNRGYVASGMVHAGHAFYSW